MDRAVIYYPYCSQYMHRTNHIEDNIPEDMVHVRLNIPENCDLENGLGQKLSYEVDYIREGSSCLLQFENFQKWLNDCGVMCDGIPRSKRLLELEVKFVLESVISRVISENNQFPI